MEKKELVNADNISREPTLQEEALSIRINLPLQKRSDKKKKAKKRREDKIREEIFDSHRNLR